MAQYTDKENVEIAQQEYENHKVGYSLETSGSGKYVGTLSDANNIVQTMENKYLLILKLLQEERQYHQQLLQKNVLK